MKISVLLASPDALDYNLIDVMRVLNTTFDELGEKLNFIKLDQKNIPPLTNQYPVNDVANIINQLSNSDGVIFACTSNLFAPCSILQNFLDYLSLPHYNNFLKDKNCFTIVVSNQTGEVETAQYLTKIINHFGGFNPVVTAINQPLASQFNKDKEVSEIFEKQVEDYYRVLRQSRKYFNNSFSIPQQSFTMPQAVPQMAPQQMPQQHFMQPQQAFMQPEQYIHQEQYTGAPNFDASQHIQEKIGVSQASNLTSRSYVPEPLQPQQNKALDFATIENQSNTSFLDNNEQNFVPQMQATPIQSNQHNIIQNNPQHSMQNNIQNDVQMQNMNNQAHQQNAMNDMQMLNNIQTQNDLSMHNQNHVASNDYQQNQFTNFNQAPQQQTPVTNNYEMPQNDVQNQSVYAMTKNLEQRFMPQASNGLVTEFQLKITGKENFDAYIQINGTECKYYEGTSSTADVTIISSDEVWKNVLIGNVSSQKAFMTGQLKVRGNFVLLPRFDQLFQ